MVVNLQGVQTVTGEVRSLATQVARLEPNVTNLMSSRARMGYTIAGMGVIITPIAAIVLAFWRQIVEFCLYLWKG